MLRKALAVALFSCVLQAQEFRSTLTGRITDPSGAAVPAAKVVATKTDTNTRFETVASTEGLYTIPLLPPGPYEVRVEAPGFKGYVQAGINVGSNARIGQDMVLQIGANTESVTVNADSPALETVTASAGQVITTREVESLPINGRSPMNLAVLGYGVVNTGIRERNRPFENSGFSTFAMGGAASGANAALLDGVSNMGTTGTTAARVAFSPPVDAVEDVKVEAFNVDAAYGGYGGGTIQITTKSGTNQLHGSASEFNQVSALAATPFFTNASGAEKPPYRQNLWGFTVGGPIILPKVYNGKDKLFFFFAYEGFRDSTPSPGYHAVPTAEERQGDFSRLLSLTNKTKNYTLYDPTSAKLSGTAVVRQPFPNNIIPKERLNPIATKFLSLYVPLPNSPGVYDDTNNFFAPGNAVNKYRSFSGRTDISLTSKNRLTLSGRQSIWSQFGNDMVDNLAYAVHPAARNQWGGTLDDVHTFSPTLVGNIRLGFGRYDAYYYRASDGYDPTELGFPSYIAANSTHLMMPVFEFSDGYAGNDGGAFTDTPFNTYQLFSSLTKIHRSHTIKLGAQVTLTDASNINWENSTGGYLFDSGSWVKSATTGSSPTMGGSMAQFLLGLPTGGSYDINAAAKNDSFYNVLFVNDDWRVRSNITLNLGLRFEYGSPTTESHDRQVIGFDQKAVNQVSQAAQAAYAKSPIPQLPADKFQALGGLLFASPSQRSVSAPRNIAPRFGATWAPSALRNRTVFRTGIGMYYYNYGIQPSIQPGFSQSNVYVPTANSYLTPAATLSNPFPNGIRQPAGASQGVNTYLGQPIVFSNPELDGQYNLRWSFDVQQQLPSDITIQVGYIGSHSVHLTTNPNMNSTPLQYLSRLPYRDTATIAAMSAVSPNPFAGLLPGTTLNGNTLSASNLLKPFPQFTGVTQNAMNNGSSYYHSLNVKLQKRFSKRLQFVVNYTHSRLMDRTNYLNAGYLELEKRVSSSDRPNSFVFTGTYDLPFSGGRNPFAKALVANWSLAGVYSYHSGAPVSWGNLIYYGGPLNYDAHNVDRAFDTTQFNTISNQQLSSSVRTFPSLFNNLRVDAANNVNLTLTKSFKIRERAKVQFRSEAFNLCNTPLFGGPGNSATSSSFGRISSQTNNPRSIQFGLRLTY